MCLLITFRSEQVVWSRTCEEANETDTARQASEHCYEFLQKGILKHESRIVETRPTTVQTSQIYGKCHGLESIRFQ